MRLVVWESCGSFEVTYVVCEFPVLLRVVSDRLRFDYSVRSASRVGWLCALALGVVSYQIRKMHPEKCNQKNPGRAHTRGRRGGEPESKDR